MSTTATHAQPSRLRATLYKHRWPIGYVTVILFLFVLYQFILPSLVKPVTAPILAWLPVATINEGGAYGLGSTWSQSVVFIILIILMVFKPEGLFGRPTTEKV